jgi:hypothetical protein
MFESASVPSWKAGALDAMEWIEQKFSDKEWVAADEAARKAARAEREVDMEEWKRNHPARRKHPEQIK